MVSIVVRKYVEAALRERIAKECPGYGPQTIEEVVSASMKGTRVTKDTLYRAIEIAASDTGC